MRARVNKPVLQAQSKKYGVMNVIQHTPEQRKQRGYGSRALEIKADKAIEELNKLFEIN
jgi:hypothetical protein